MKTFILAILFISAATGVRAQEENANTNSPETSKTIKRKPMVVMKQANISGKAFLLADVEDESSENAAAKYLAIEVRTKDGADLIYESATDENGDFSIPNLDVGEYSVTVGLLKIELHVKDADPDGITKSVIPKKIIVFIPKAMEKKANPKLIPDKTEGIKRI